MAIQTVVNFQSCASAVEEIANPQGEVDGRAFVIIDNDNNTVYRFVMPLDVARQQGQRLMGIGNLAVTNGQGMKKAISEHEKRKS